MSSTVDAHRITEREEKASSLRQKMKTLADWVRKSRYTVFYTGAGVSTSAGVGDYRGPTGAWTMRRIRELEKAQSGGRITREESRELRTLQVEAAKKGKQVSVPMIDAQPTPTHMAMATLIRRGMAHYVVTTNLDGIHRKSGLKAHDQICNLHGCVYAERCTNPDCGYEFQRNYETRQGNTTHVHDHYLGTCAKCHSSVPKSYTGRPKRGAETGSGTSFSDNGLVSTTDENVGTKDTHINFGENLDERDWAEADEHCRRADLVIVAGTSMSLRHITHFPFLAKRTVIVNLQATPDDNKCDLRLWGKTDPVFEALTEELQVPIDPLPPWKPRDSLPLKDIPSYVHPYYKRAAARLEATYQKRLKEAQQRKLKAAAEKKAAEAKRAKEAKARQEAEKDAEKARQARENLRAAVVDVLSNGLRIGNLHTPVPTRHDGNAHRWTAYVTSYDERKQPLSELVASVQWHLHPTFTPKVVNVTAPSVALTRKPEGSFALSRVGWGTFKVRAVINWKPATGMPPTKLSHVLSFAEGGASRLVKAAIDEREFDLESVSSGSNSGGRSVASGICPPGGLFC